MSAGRTLLVTGASGFLGARVVAAARARGWTVRALSRRPDGAGGRAVDLGAPDAAAAAGEAVAGVDAVVHAAAAMAGDDARHARDTVAPTAAVIEAMAARAPTARLVLVSSFAVYGAAALPAGALLDETTPREPDPDRRDAYCRAKLAQERLAIAAAQRRGLAVRLARPGAVFGPGRTRTARLGLALGPLLARARADALVPGVDVADCAAALVLAAETAIPRSDVPIPQGGGALDAVNLVHPDPPTVAAWLDALRPAGWPKRAVPAPLRPMRLAAEALALAADLVPAVGRATPGPLRAATLDARFKPLRYSAARQADRLGFAPAAPALAQLAAAVAAGAVAPQPQPQEDAA